MTSHKVVSGLADELSTVDVSGNVDDPDSVDVSLSRGNVNDLGSVDGLVSVNDWQC